MPKSLKHRSKKRKQIWNIEEEDVKTMLEPAVCWQFNLQRPEKSTHRLVSRGGLVISIMRVSFRTLAVFIRLASNGMHWGTEP
jgi:hypothetical protein